MPITTEIHAGWNRGQIAGGTMDPETGQPYSLLNMPDQSFTHGRNLEINANGSIRVRRFLQPVVDPILESSVPTNITGMASFQNSSAREIIIASGTKWRRWDATGTAVTTTDLSGLSGQTADTRVSFTRWRDATRNWLIGAQTGMNTQYYDGTSINTLLTAYQFKHLASWQGHLFGTEANSNLLRYSELSNPTSFFEARAFVLNDQRGGDITMIGGHNDVLLYAGRNQLNLVEGRSYLTFQPYPVSSSIGCVAHESFQSTMRGAMWLSNNGVYIFNGGEPQRMAALDDVFGGIDMTKLGNVWSAHYQSPVTKQHKYVLAISRNQEVRTNAYILEYVVEKNAWHVHTGDQAVAFAVGRDTNGNDLLYSAKDDAIVELWDQPITDKQVSVHFDFVDRPYALNHPLAEKVLDRVYIWYQANKQATLDIRVTPDFRGSAQTWTKTLTADTTVPDQFQYDMLPLNSHFLQNASVRKLVVAEGMAIPGTYFQVQVRNTEGGRDFQIFAIGLEASIDLEHWNQTIGVLAA